MSAPQRTQRLGFVLHLGDIIYEVVEYPEEVPHRYDRTVFDIGKMPDARKVDNFHVPTTLAGYRMVYQAHIRDPDIQDARAHFPFVCIGDNHEFSWQGWQSFIQYGGKKEPAQPLRVAANQAWWSTSRRGSRRLRGRASISSGRRRWWPRRSQSSTIMALATRPITAPRSDR